MKISDIFYMSEKNYPAIEDALKNNALPENIKSEIIQMMEDHKRVTGYAKKLAEQQSIQASKMFGYQDTENTPARLFDENHNSYNENPADQEKNADINSSNQDNSKKKRTYNGRYDLKNKPHTEVITHHLENSQKQCSCCKNQMIKSYTVQKTVVMSMPLFKTYTHEIETYRCLGCETKAVAHAPKELDETMGRYHFSAVANLAALRYLWGMPAFRIQAYSKNVGLEISDSTHFYLMEKAADRVINFYNFLKTEAAKAPVKYIDDTHMLVINMMQDIEEKKQTIKKNGDDPRSLRTGIHSSNLTAEFSADKKIALYQTGIQHSGEFLEKIMSAQSVTEQTIVMSDALSANFSKNKKIAAPIANAACNVHARRNFYELKDIYQKQVDEALILYARIFKNEKFCNHHLLTAHERLVYHQQHSLPVMQALKAIADNAIESKKVEPNSKLGQAYRYLSKHWDKLTLFLKEENAPITNSEAERMLKVAIRHRKNSLFYKTEIGAKVGDILMTILVTAHINNISPNEYLQNLFLYKEHWKQHPNLWLPWNYNCTMKTIFNNEN